MPYDDAPPPKDLLDALVLDDEGERAWERDMAERGIPGEPWPTDIDP